MFFVNVYIVAAAAAAAKKSDNSQGLHIYIANTLAQQLIKMVNISEISCKVCNQEAPFHIFATNLLMTMWKRERGKNIKFVCAVCDTDDNMKTPYDTIQMCVRDMSAVAQQRSHTFTDGSRFLLV